MPKSTARQVTEYGTLIPDFHETPENIGRKIFSGGSETGRDFPSEPPGRFARHTKARRLAERRGR